jgi:hypothetical protein
VCVLTHTSFDPWAATGAANAYKMRCVGHFPRGKRTTTKKITLSAKGHIVIPVDLREALVLEAGDKLIIRSAGFLEFRVQRGGDFGDTNLFLERPEVDFGVFKCFTMCNITSPFDWLIDCLVSKSRKSS